MIDDSETLGTLCRYGFRCEVHLLHDAKRTRVEKRQHAGHVVWDAEPGRRPGKSSARRSNDEVAGKGHFASSTPNSTFDHGNDGSGQFFAGPHELMQRIIPSQWIAAAFGEFGNVVARRPHLCPVCDSHHNEARAFSREASQGIYDGVDELLRERLSLRGMIEDFCADPAIDFCLQVLHRALPSLLNCIRSRQMDVMCPFCADQKLVACCLSGSKC